MASGQELAQYYVQIIPSADGIGNRIAQEIDKDDPGTKSGENIGKKLIKALAAAKIGQTIYKSITDAIAAGGNLEQSIGGIEQIFGAGSKATEELKKNAQEAYKYAQVNANDYMQQVTSFSARLMQGLGGDTEATVKYADMAIRQMSDNASTFGTDIGSIQNAYQGFARANWTMLDNLRLGYGGTASEMARLVNDSGVMGKNFTATAKNINSVSFDKIIEAIGVVQDRMNITGKTAAEAADTLQGSAAAMKSAWTNLLADIAIGEDFSTALAGFTQSAVDYAGNLIKMVANVVRELPGAIITVVKEIAPQVIEHAVTFIENFTAGIEKNAKKMTTTGSELLKKVSDGIIKAMPSLIKLAGNLVKEAAKAFITNLPTILKAGAQFIGDLLKGISNNLPSIYDTIKGMVSELWNIIKNINWLQLGSDIISTIINGIKSMISSILNVGGQLASDVGDKIKGFDWLGLGANIIKSIISGITSMFGGILGKVGELASGMIDKIKNSSWIQTGKDIMTGVKDGIANKVSTVVNKIGDIVTEAKDKMKNGGWYGVGEQMMNGVKSGVESKAASLVAAAKAAVWGALGGAKAILGIKSPSREFAKLGEFVDLGFAEGISDNYKVIEKAMSGFADAVDPSLDMNALQPRFGEFVQPSSSYNYGGFSVNVYAQDGESANDIADEVMERINNQIMRQREVFG